MNRSVTYSDVTDDALDDMIKDIVAGNDQLGSEAVRAHLRAGGVRVQRDKVREFNSNQPQGSCTKGNGTKKTTEAIVQRCWTKLPLAA